MISPEKRLFLRLRDRVIHVHHEEWGTGVVVEEMTSVVPGGTCLVRVLFRDGTQRTFCNDLDNELCCCFFGIQKETDFDFSEFRPVKRSQERGGRRRLGGRDTKARLPRT